MGPRSASACGRRAISLQSPPSPPLPAGTATPRSPLPALMLCRNAWVTGRLQVLAVGRGCGRRLISREEGCAGPLKDICFRGRLPRHGVVARGLWLSVAFCFCDSCGLGPGPGPCKCQAGPDPLSRTPVIHPTPACRPERKVRKRNESRGRAPSYLFPTTTERISPKEYTIHIPVIIS